MKTDHRGTGRLEIRIVGEDGTLRPLALNPVPLGTQSQITAIIVYSNGTQVPAVAANWTFPNNVMFVAGFNMTRGFAMATPVVTQGPNPVTFIPWCLLGTNGVPPPLTAADILCSGQAPTGEWLNGQDVLPISFPAMTLNIALLKQSAEPTVDNSQMGPSWLNYGADVGGTVEASFDFAGLPGGAQLGLIQTVNSSRIYYFSDGSQAILASTNGQYFLDAKPNTPNIFYEGPVTNAAEDLAFVDRPQQPLEFTWNNEEVVASIANDVFTLYVMYNPGAGNSVWCPIQAYSWGWEGRAVLADDDDSFELDPNYSGIVAFDDVLLTQLYWTASISDSVIQPNGAPQAIRGRRRLRRAAGTKISISTSRDAQQGERPPNDASLPEP